MPPGRPADEWDLNVAELLPMSSPTKPQPGSSASSPLPTARQPQPAAYALPQAATAAAQTRSPLPAPWAIQPQAATAFHPQQQQQPAPWAQPQAAAALQPASAQSSFSLAPGQPPAESERPAGFQTPRQVPMPALQTPRQALPHAVQQPALRLSLLSPVQPGCAPAAAKERLSCAVLESQLECSLTQLSVLSDLSRVTHVQGPTCSRSRAAFSELACPAHSSRVQAWHSRCTGASHVQPWRCSCF